MKKTVKVTIKFIRQGLNFISEKGGS